MLTIVSVVDIDLWVLKRCSLHYVTDFLLHDGDRGGQQVVDLVLDCEGQGHLIAMAALNVNRVQCEVGQGVAGDERVDGVHLGLRDGLPTDVMAICAEQKNSVKTSDARVGG